MLHGRHDHLSLLGGFDPQWSSKWFTRVGACIQPIFTPIIYPIANFLNCFQILTPMTILHVYHYIVNLFPNGWILVSSSNTHQFDALHAYSL
jgi:hypothetical protein